MKIVIKLWLAILLGILTVSTPIQASVMHDTTQKLKKLKMRVNRYGYECPEVVLTKEDQNYTAIFEYPQGMAEISICDEYGKETDTFTASTDVPIEWYMPEYEGYTVTITTDFAVYEAEF